MIHLDTLASHAPAIIAVVLGVPLIVVLHRGRRARPDHVAVLREAGLCDVPTVDAHSGGVRVR